MREIMLKYKSVYLKYRAIQGGETVPNIKSAKKRTKVIAAKTLKNKMFKTNLKTVVKKYETAVAANDASGLEQSFRAAVKKLDQAVARGLIHKNKAARKKSQFAKKLAAAKEAK